MVLKVKFLSIVLASVLLTGCFKEESPITIMHRESAVGRGKVVVITNPSGQKVAIDVLISSSETDQEATLKYTLNPRTFAEIGWAQGWQFVSGEEIIVSSNKYSDVEYTIP